MKIKILFIFIQIYVIASQSFNTSVEEVEEDEEIVYGSPKEGFGKRPHPAEDVKNRMDNIKSNMVNLGYDFSKAIRILYSNYTNLDLKVSDIDVLYKKGIINENQAILIWENLLNTKTERNLEWLGYNKLLKNGGSQKEQQGNKMIQNVMTLFHSPEYKCHSIFTYVGGIVCLYLMKVLLKYPKLNITLIFFLMMANIIHAYYFYKHKHYFTSSISLASFISNIYYFYMSLVVLSGNKTIDYTILHTRHFKSKEHFLVKTGICTFIIVLLTYLASVSLRCFFNYLIIFFFIEKNRKMIKNYFKLISPKNIQPFENFISLIFSSVVLIYTHMFYYINISFSYDLNSFLIMNNMIIFYYITALEKFIYIQRNRLGGVYLDCEKINDNRDKYELFEELKKKSHIEKNFRNDNFYEGNIIDIILIFLCLIFLSFGFYLNTYFYLIIAIFILHTIHKNCLIFLSIKISRVFSNFLLLMFLIAISNLDQLDFSYINEIIAVYDQKFLEALLLLFKLLFLVSLAICNYLSEDFVDLFNIYNYSSYSYLYKETRMITNNNEMTRRLNHIYTVRNVLSEIFQFKLETSLECVNVVLDSINNSGSNIDGFYIEYLLTKSTSNYYIFPMLLDYFLMYFNLWILFDTFRNNNHSFFYITFMLHKVGLFCKMFLLDFEYSKTILQKNLIIVLNMLFSLRILSYPEIEDMESVVILFFFLLNVFIYILIYENVMAMNIFILFFNWIMLNNNPNSSAYVAISVGALFAKNLIYFFQIRNFKPLIYIICAVNSFIIFSSLDKKLISSMYHQFKLAFVNFLKFDLISIFENLSFAGNKRDDSDINLYLENFLIAKMKQFLIRLKSY